MKIFILILASLLLSTIANATPSVKIQPAFILGLWGFASFDRGHFGSSAIEEAYRTSSVRTPEKNQLLETVRDIARVYFEGNYPFPNAAEGRDEQSWDVFAHFASQSARSKNLEEFRSRTQGLIPTLKHQELFRALEKLSPVYDSLIWKPNLGQLKKDQSRMESLIKKSGFEKIFAAQKAFYRANWDDKGAFNIRIAPIPAKSGATHATVIGDTGLVQFLQGEKDLEGRFGVILHELGHSLYSSESPEFQKEMALWFTSSKSPTAHFAYNDWEEVLSTITGNGWAYEKAAGRIDAGEWYQNHEYNGWAKGLYPLAKTYFESKRPIDKEFADTAIALFQTLFPDAARRQRRLLRNALLISDGTFGSSLDLTKTCLSRGRWIHHCTADISFKKDEVVGSLNQSDHRKALVIVAQPRELEKFAALGIPQLKEMAKGIDAVPGYATALDSEGRLILVIQAKSLLQFSEIFAQVNPDDATPLGNHFTPYSLVTLPINKP
ncbi:MAG: hypothetical protein H7301_13360 [Cryobacterium sp.]|nr:hypothetical protein [Oligoflexia bacterium]